MIEVNDFQFVTRKWNIANDNSNANYDYKKCIAKIDGTIIDDTKILYLVIPMYNLIEYSSNYSETTGSL